MDKPTPGEWANFAQRCDVMAKPMKEIAEGGSIASAAAACTEQILTYMAEFARLMERQSR